MNIKKYISPGQGLAAFTAALSLTAFFCAFKEGTVDLSLVDSVSFPLYLAAAILIFILLVSIGASLKSKAFIPSVLFTAALIYASYAAYKWEKNVWMCLGLMLVMALSALYLVKNIREIDHIKISPAVCLVFCIGVFTVMTVFLSYVSVTRYASFNAPSYDLGIFTQLFEYMRKTGLPLTTIERNQLMSHFGVHFSPGLYLLLPFYMIKPAPETLLILQAALIYGAVFPLYMILKELKQDYLSIILWISAYALYPAFFASGMTDFHENKLLCFLMLFLIYFILKDRTVPTVIFSILVLSVKEDAVIYVGALALWMIITKKESRKTGCIMLLLCIIWFALSALIIGYYGEGMMTSRFSDYQTEMHSEGLSSVIRNILIDPAYFVSRLFTAEKASYLICMLLPLGLLPLFQKKAGNAVLFIPLVVENLMSGWQYQADIDHQYSYGSGALLIFLALLALNGSSFLKKRFFSLLALSCGLILFINANTSRIHRYLEGAEDNAALIEETAIVLERIPQGAVMASSMFTPHLYDREVLYSGAPVYYEEEHAPDFMAVDIRYRDNHQASLELAQLYGLELIDKGGYAQIYGRK